MFSSSVRAEETVTVHGRRAPRASGDETSASTVVRGQQLEEPGADAARIIARTPGVQSSRTGSSADATTLSIRGADSSQVPIYLAGIRLNDDAVGSADLSRVPPWMLHRAEVYRGTAPADVDTFGLGGAVLFEPNLPSSTELHGGILGGSWRTYGAWAGASVASERRAGQPWAASSFSLRYDTSASNYTYRDDRGTGFDPSDDGVAHRQNADFEQVDAWSLSRFTLPTPHGPSRITVLLNALGREQGVTGLSVIPATQSRAQSSRELAGVSTKTPCMLAGDPCRIDATTSFHHGNLTTTDPLGELALGSSWVHQSNTRSTTRLAFVGLPGEDLRWTISALFDAGRLAIDEPGLARMRASDRRIGATGTVQQEFLPGVLAQGSLRAQCQDVEGREGDSSGEGSSEDASASRGACEPEGKLGLRYQLAPSLSLRTNGARSVRFPSLGERYGVTASVRGNSELDVEAGWSADVGALYETPLGESSGLWAEGWLFGRWTSDLIAYQRSALGYVRPYNVGSARFLGAEVSLGAQLWNHLNLQTSLSALDPRNTSEDRTTENDLVPFRSQLTNSNRAEVYTTFEDSGIQRIGLTLYVDYRGGRVADPAGLMVIPGHVLTDLALAASVAEDSVFVRARLENLFDTAHYDTVGFPLPGRSLYVSVEGRWP